MEEISGIPIVQLADVIKPVLDRYGRPANDLAIRNDILADIRRALVSGDKDRIRLFLSQDEAYWIGTLQWAYFQRFEGVNPLEGYKDWARAKCDLLLAIASRTREDDGIIQHLLNYEDFHVEVLPFPFGPSFIVRLYEMRGLDFFLFHYMGGETSAALIIDWSTVAKPPQERGKAALPGAVVVGPVGRARACARAPARTRMGGVERRSARRPWCRRAA
ncbi:hypothetical protein BDD21_2281 [Thiocapsa rosea]|uniref:Uncharacterized protein n=1 Tax=Thiocapsa rosea TaxID=69360 RepID=A0A495V931_9GAMM|nr:hypothetical protein BDD21_2281 [Thiocapsa rosea]